MWNKTKTSIILLISILGLFAPATDVYAGNFSLTESCNVQVYIKGTVPDSVEQGKTFNLSNFTVQPANTYGFNVTSSVYYLTATNTSSTTYTQDFYATNPSPTTGHNTYIGYYPNWTLDAKGAVGSSVTITLIKSVTVIQGYGGSPVTCNFSKTLTTVPITAPTPVPSSQPSPAPSSQPSSHPSSSPVSSSSSTNKSASSSSTASAASPAPSSASTAAAQPGTVTPTNTGNSSAGPGEQSVSVVPLNIQVNDSTGKSVTGAEVTLDSGKKLVTDNDGRVVFSNVLTGSHIILVSYNGQRLNKNISLSANDIGAVKSISLPEASSTLNPVAIGAAAVGTVAAGAGAGYFLLLRRRRAAGATDNGQSVTIHGIIDGSAVPAPAERSIEHIPAIPAFDAQPAMPGPAHAPAPWDPASLVMPVLNSEAAPAVAQTVPVAPVEQNTAAIPEPAISAAAPAEIPAPPLVQPLAEQPVQIVEPAAAPAEAASAAPLPTIEHFATPGAPVTVPEIPATQPAAQLSESQTVLPQNPTVAPQV